MASSEPRDPVAGRRGAVGLLAGAALMTTPLGQAAPNNGAFKCTTAARLFVDRFCRHGAALDNDNGDIWHTESLGVSMLAAVAVRDDMLFALMDQQARMIRRPDGLHSWKVVQGAVADRNNATDGDLFIAWAYLQAATAFSTSRAPYLALAQQTLDAIVKHCVRQTPHGWVLVPGAEGFFDAAGKVKTVNLSYWIYPALQAFARHEPKGPWSTLIESGRKITGYSYFGEHALPPDWLELSTPVKPDVSLSTRFSYDAMRIPLYLHLAGYGQDATVSRCLKFYGKTQKTWADLTNGQTSPYGIDPSADIVVRQLRSNRLQPATIKNLPAKYFPASLAVLADMPVCA